MQSIILIYDQETNTPVIPVLIEIYQKHLSTISDSQNKTLKEKVDYLIQHGLHAQLETSSLISGSKFVSLQIDDALSDKTAALTADRLTGYDELPTKPQSITQITDGITKVLNKVNELPLNQLTGNLNNLLSNTDKLVNDKLNTLLTNTDKLVTGKKINTIIANLDSLLAETRKMPNDVKHTLKALDSSVRSMTKTVNSTLSGLSPDAPLYYNLNNTLLQLNDTLQSIKAVTDLIDRTPNALIFGEDRHDKK